MKYIVCQEPGTFLLKERVKPIRGKREALLKVKEIGICGTDLHAYSGNQAFFTYPRILGHEIGAEIIEIGDNEQGLRNGDKVIIMPYISCYKCVACRNGITNACTNIQVLGVHTDGAMQEYITVPNDLLISAENLNTSEIAIVEPLAIGAHAIRRADLKDSETILVVGCGPIGIGIMKLAQIRGAKVIAMDVSEQRLTYAQDEIGVDFIVNALESPLEKIMDITNGDLANAVFDASGNKRALESGIQYMSHGGRYILVGLSKGDLNFNHPSIHAKESSILCSRNATTEDFINVREAISTGLFPTDSFITHRVNFSEMIDHFDQWTQPDNGVIKAMVSF